MSKKTGELSQALNNMAHMVQWFDIDGETLEGVNPLRDELQVTAEKFWQIARKVGRNPECNEFNGDRHYHFTFDGIRIVCVHEMPESTKV